MSRSVRTRRSEGDVDGDVVDVVFADADDPIHPGKSDANTPDRIMADTRSDVRRLPMIKDSS